MERQPGKEGADLFRWAEKEPPAWEVLRYRLWMTLTPSARSQLGDLWNELRSPVNSLCDNTLRMFYFYFSVVLVGSLGAWFIPVLSLAGLVSDEVTLIGVLDDVVSYALAILGSAGMIVVLPKDKSRLFTYVFVAITVGVGGAACIGWALRSPGAMLFFGVLATLWSWFVWICSTVRDDSLDPQIATGGSTLELKGDTAGFET